MRGELIDPGLHLHAEWTDEDAEEAPRAG